MGRRTVEIVQAEIVRTAKALRQSGLRPLRVVTRRDSVTFELEGGVEHRIVPSNDDAESEIVL